MSKLADRLKKRAEGLKTELPALFLALKQPDTPWYAKVLAGLTAAYALSPVDLIPDFIPVLGYLDDLILLPALAAATVRLIPKDVLARCRAQAKDMVGQAGAKKWVYALPILALWLCVAFFILRALWLWIRA